MRLVCTSVLFYPANAPGNVSMRMGTNHNLDNGEAFFRVEGFTHATGFVIDLQGFPMAGLFEFDIPLIDQNGNGLEDFFEVEQGISNQTMEGIWETSDGFDFGGATLTWNRPAGSALGTCRIVMVSDTFGELPAFNHQFELLEYEGTLKYGLERPSFAGEISIASQDGVWTLAGPVDLQIGQAEGE